MPELPEVQTFKKYFDSTALNQRIEAVGVDDDKIIRDRSGDDFKRRMRGRTFLDSYRRGKYLFARMDNEHHLQLHFGMTGDLNYYSEPDDRSKYERFVFQFDNGFRLGFDCPRKFARICYVEDLDTWIADLGLGEDALEISREIFLEQASGRNASLKGFLMNQKYVAGLGNLYVDEVCYQTRIDPASRVAAVPPKKLEEIYEKMQEILRTAIDRNAYYKEYPENWFWEWRHAEARSPNGGPAESRKIAGRTTWYFPDYQKLYK